MQMKLWTKVIAVLPMMCLAAFASAAQSQDSSQQQTGDPVADAARKARETKKDAPKPKKVYTDDDLKKSTPAPVAPPASAPGNGSLTVQATTPQSAGDATKTEDPNGETAWRKRFKDHRDKIA